MSYDKNNTTVEKYFAQELPYLLMREQRKLGYNNIDFAEHLSISLESLENYRNGMSIPRSDTFMKIISKCSIDFFADIFATAGLHDKYSIVSETKKPETGISIVKNEKRK